MNNVLNVEEVFAGRLLRIPDYQRGYAWDEPQWRDFIEDIELLPDRKDHFTGTLVFHEQAAAKALIDETGKKYETYDVVDGQQRLTTIVVFLDALRHQMQSYPKLNTLVAGIANSYLYVNDLNGERMYKLTLNQDCHPFFIGNILADPVGVEGPVIASHQRLRDAKKYFREYLAKRFAAMSPDDSTWILELYDKVTHRLRLSLYSVTEASDVGVIFEVMNNRGKPLSELEKVKNYLLYVGSKLDLPQHTLPEKVNRTWTNIFERLMAADLSDLKDENQLLRTQWLMAYDFRSRNFDGSNSIKAHFRLRDYPGRSKELLASLLQYTKTLDESALAYCDIMHPGRSDSFSAFKGAAKLRAEIVRASEKLERINVVATFLPLLIAARLRYPEDGSKYLELVRQCEVFAFRVNRLLEKRSDAGQKTIFRVANELFTGAIEFDEALRQLRSELVSYCPAHTFAEQFKLNEKENNWYGRSCLKYLLYEYEEYLAKDHVVQLPWNEIAKRPIEQTIEHILPQTPTDPYWASRFDGPGLRCFLHDLGNLCLTSDNSSYRNKSFPDKKGKPGAGPCFADSNLFQERELATYDEWNGDAVKRRRERIVEWAMKRWHVDESGTTLSEVSADNDEEAD